MAHAAKHPRPSLEELRRSAEVAIAFPMGYTLSWGLMWGNRAFEHERLNRAGVPYRDVVAAAMWEAILCAKRGIPFDLTVDDGNLNNLGYRQILRVGEDARLYSFPPQLSSEPAHFTLEASMGKPTAVEVPEAIQPTSATPAYDRDIRIDADLGDWQGADWIVFDGPPCGGEAWDGPKDLSARVAFAYDERWFYVAAHVTDDVQHQPKTGWHIFVGDSIQVGLDPLNLRSKKSYLDDQHEFGLALVNKRPMCYRWHGRRGQPIDRLADANVAIVRREDQGRTIYEAALPLSSLAPLAPETVPQAGFCVVINDNDGKGRDAMHETSPGAMTQEKRPIEFRSLFFPSSTDRHRKAVGGPRCWATLTWPKNVFRQKEPIPFELYTMAWEAADARIEIALRPLDVLLAAEARCRLNAALATQPARRTVQLRADTPPPGRYRLRVIVQDAKGTVLVDDKAPVFIYP